MKGLMETFGLSAAIRKANENLPALGATCTYPGGRFDDLPALDAAPRRTADWCWSQVVSIDADHDGNHVAIYRQFMIGTVSRDGKPIPTGLATRVTFDTMRDERRYEVVRDTF